MMNSQHHLYLLCGLLAAPKDATPFTVPTSYQFSAWQVKKAATTGKTTLFAGLSSTESYLSSLSNIAKTQTGSATDVYLESLSHIASSLTGLESSTVSPEEYLTSLTSQLVEAASSTGANVDNGGIYLADVGLTDASTFIALDSDTSVGAGLSDSLTSQISEMSIVSVVNEKAIDNPIQQAASDLSDSLTAQLSGLTGSSLVDERVTEAASKSIEQTATGFDPLASQLSGLSYDSLLSEETTKTTSSVIQQADTNKLVDMAASSSASISDGVAQMSKLFGQATASLQDAPKTVATGTNIIAQKGSETIYAALEAEKSNIIAGTTATVNEVRVKSLTELANGVVDGIQTMGSLFLQVLNEILHDLGGTSVAKLVESAQMSINTLVNSSVDYVVATLNDIGHMSMAQVVQSLVSLILLVSKIVFVVVNAVIKIFSGKEITDWSLAATGAVEQKASILAAQANTAAIDLSHKSLMELSSMVGEFSHEAGRQIALSMSILNDVVTGGSQLAANGVSLAGGSIDSAAVQMSQLL